MGKRFYLILIYVEFNLEVHMLAMQPKKNNSDLTVLYCVLMNVCISVHVWLFAYVPWTYDKSLFQMQSEIIFEC